MYNSTVPRLILLIALLTPGLAVAHGDTEKPLFVAEDGVDAGSCDSPDAPCRSIGFALTRAGKGAQIRVASGSYPVENPEDLFHVVSGVIGVAGGFEKSDRFSRPGRGVSVLTGVPPEFRELLAESGFQVVSDRKAIGNDNARKALALMQQHEELQAGFAAAPCQNGSVRGLACTQVDLLSHLAFADISRRPAASNDVWGFVDLNSGREYAIIGFNSGTAFIDVTDPENPLELGFVDGQNASWRDIKVHQQFDSAAQRWRAYAYITTDGSTDGLFVVDMSGLPHSVKKADYVSDFSSAHNVYLSDSDFATGIALGSSVPHLIVAGSNLSAGRYLAYTLQDPLAPTLAGGAQTPDYMHDAASMTIRDARKDTQCVNAADTCTVLMDFNETSIDLWDFSQPANPVRLSQTPYSNVAYTHSGWPSEDGEYLYVHDELDEQRFGLPTTLRVFSLADLRTPVQVGAWSGITTAIDHNGFVRGNRYYMSNYSRGLTVLDLTNPAAPVAVGRLDTYPFSDSGSFAGAWGAYPYLPSGSIAVSDIESGLFIADDRTREVAEGMLSFAASSVAVEEGQAAQIIVERIGGATGAVTVGWEVVPATIDTSDIAVLSGVLAWSDGEAASKAISIPAASDGVGEELEHALVRLIDPEGGATLGNKSYSSLYLADPGAGAELSLFSTAITVAERGFGQAIVIVRRHGNATGPASVNYSMTAGDAVAGTDFTGSTSGTIDWPAGHADPRYLQFTMIDDGASESSEFFELTFSNPSGATFAGTAVATITIDDGSGIDHSPNAVAGASQVVSSGVDVTLDGAQSNDPDGDALSYAWAQVLGPPVTLSAADTTTASFAAPEVTSDTLLRFRLTVSDPDGLADTASVSVTVLAPGSGGLSSNGGGSVGLLLLLLLMSRIGIRFYRSV